VVPRITGADDGLLLQNLDGRIIFVLPFEGAFTLIGTTDVPVSGSPSEAVCTVEEEDYLLDAANRYLATPLSRREIVWRFAGVRPLQAGQNGADPSTLSRDYQLVHSGARHGEFLLTVIGGKITTYRALAEAVVRRLAPLFPGLGPNWTAGRTLPGGDLPNEDFGLYLESLSRLYAWLPDPVLQALVRRHGTLVREVVGDARRLEDMGRLYAAGLSEREVSYLADNEWAMTPEDVLWRRTKAGLHLRTAEARSEAAASIAALL
jgi:glycerol-3-phosphate dehydrogenase